MTVFREKATQLADLPHQFEQLEHVRYEACAICGCASLEARHVAWEKASLAPASDPLIAARERGI